MFFLIAILRLAIVSLIAIRTIMTKKIYCIVCWSSMLIGMDTPNCKRYCIDRQFSLDSLQRADDLEQKILTERLYDIDLNNTDRVNLLIRYNKEEAIKRLCIQNLLNPTIEHLQEAIAAEQTSLALFFLSLDPTLIKAQNSLGTPLHIASLYNNKLLAATFLALGIDINAVNKHHDTPLHLAAKKGFVEMVSFLCEHGANPLIKNVRKFNRTFDAIDVAYRNMFRFKDKRDMLLTTISRQKTYYSILHIMYAQARKLGASVNENFIIS